MYIKNYTLLFSLLFSLTSIAQTNYTVSTSGMSFSPSELTIEIGDTVTFINTGGNHNVNGTQATFPNNPDSFGNSVSSGWTYQHVFSIDGEYDFQCDPHSNAGMKGKIIVQNSTSVQNLDSKSNLNIFPNPFQNSLSIPDCDGAEVFLYSILGQLEINQLITNDSFTFTTDELTPGVYLYKIIKTNTETFSGKIVKR